MKRLFCLFVIITVFASSLEYSFVTQFIDVPLDHFSFTSNTTFKLRYLVNDTYHDERGPIFFYTGNEGDINMFAQNAGFLFDIAPLFNALIVFAEHRYYGVSLPFGNKSYDSPEHLGYLSSEQALADYVYLLNDLQKKYEDRYSRRLPVVAFGGSYGGMLSAWIRMKYPNAVVGSIASSAPIWQFQGLTPCENFYRITTNVFESLGSESCRTVIQKSWPLIRAAVNNKTRKANLTQYWKLCNPLNTTDDIQNLVSWVSGIYVNLAMSNYPYPTDFLAKLPAYPVREFCSRIKTANYKDDDSLLQALGQALEVYTNYTGSTKCNSIVSTSPQLGELGWNFQACTEMIMPMCSNNFDMFEDEVWDFQQYSKDCFKLFGITPRSQEVPILAYGGKNLRPYSNIVFSNGLLDPWSSGGVLSNITSRVVAVIIPDGAHHFDLRGRHPGDLGTVIEARRFHVRQIRKWLNDYYYEHFDEPEIFYT